VVIDEITEIAFAFTLRPGVSSRREDALRFLVGATDLKMLDSGCRTDYLAEITYTYLIEIADDNVAHPCNHLRNEVFEVTTG
jgi:hypothetical protein